MNSELNYVEITHDSIDKWKQFSDRSLSLLSKYCYLTDSYVLDFFSCELWDSIPELWRTSLEPLTPWQLAAALLPPCGTPHGTSQDCGVNTVLPLSLLAFRVAASSCSLPRGAVASLSPFVDYLQRPQPSPPLIHSLIRPPTASSAHTQSPPPSHSLLRPPTASSTHKQHPLPTHSPLLSQPKNSHKSPLPPQCHDDYCCGTYNSGSKDEVSKSHGTDATVGFVTQNSTKNSERFIRSDSPDTAKNEWIYNLKIRNVSEIYHEAAVPDSYIAKLSLGNATENIYNAEYIRQKEASNYSINTTDDTLVTSGKCYDCSVDDKRLAEDSLLDNSSKDSLQDNCSKDSLEGNSSQGSLEGNSYNDSLVDNSAKDSLEGISSKDSLLDNSSKDSLEGNWSKDSLEGNSSKDSLLDTSSKDSLEGNSSKDFLLDNCSKDSGLCNREPVAGSDELLVHEEVSALHWPSDERRTVMWQVAGNKLNEDPQHQLCLSHIFRCHLKPKKQHEVARLSLVTSLASEATCCDVTVDIGSGCGHLARLMAYGYKLRVVCVDKEEDFVRGARQFDAQLEKSLSKLCRRQQGVMFVGAGPRHATCLLQPGMGWQHFTRTVLSRWSPGADVIDNGGHGSHCSAETTATTQPGNDSEDVSPLSNTSACQHHPTTSMVRRLAKQCNDSEQGYLHSCPYAHQETIVTESHQKEFPSSFGLTGLHTCGDLAATLLQLFVRSPHCRYLASVACCYMKLATEQDTPGTENIGYPLSHHLAHRALTYAARELACHAIESYSARLSEGCDNLKVHCYRAALEVIILKHWPHHKRAGLKPVKRAHTMPFPEYAVSAVRALDGGLLLPAADLTSDQTAGMLRRWRQVVVFYTLRLLLAPVIETVLLLDRSFYLYEQGVSSILVPAFDPHLSPRNMVLLAVKR